MSFANSLESQPVKCFNAGERLMVQDKNAREIMILKSGVTKCYRSEENGKELIFEFLGKGEILGDLETILRRVCLCSVEAITPVEAYVFSLADFDGLIDSDKTFHRKLLEELALRIYQTSTRASYQQNYPVEYSLIKFLMIQKEQQLSFSKQDIADYLAITVRSLNRTVKQLREGAVNPELAEGELKQLLSDL
ncbi:cAMP-binding domain of CRP or a regulatory subunit of cAMP-dependent protein kinases [Chitinophaga sancti]|uniref:cAMP-binding domain of CRP or a regulatory subunit of cAMP-dependent protein kinases n=1 Tax=Chitinophaga sancti TaxID=1004 RepID=A0A1K1N1J7_9BACT|nr:cAMP-binding domain of CRP or a regulatory subunit of cAMP-dependent protein kinases [Chitinophaga sancti]